MFSAAPLPLPTRLPFIMRVHINYFVVAAATKGEPYSFSFSNPAANVGECCVKLPRDISVWNMAADLICLGLKLI